jgi:hypothetical protein
MNVQNRFAVWVAALDAPIQELANPQDNFGANNGHGVRGRFYI